jgi:23S rRNA pseudouridine2457 synthase
LTKEGWVQHRIADPAHKQAKTYFVQVEGEPTPSALRELREGVALAELRTRPADVERVDEPAWLWTREPPVRFRRLIPTCWIRLVLTEGKNRQIRRMTAAVGFPTLRLIRYGVGIWTVDSLAPGQWREVEAPWPTPDRPAPEPRTSRSKTGSQRQPFDYVNVKGRAIPHPTKRKKR